MRILQILILTKSDSCGVRNPLDSRFRGNDETGIKGWAR